MNTKTFQKISYGLYVVASKKPEFLNGQIANTVFQVASDPPIIAVSINKKNLTHECIETSKIFSISILSKDTPLEFIGWLGFRTGREVKKFEKVQYRIGVIGSPIVLDYAVGYFECELEKEIDVITHTVFFGRVREAEIISEADPMTYDYYHKIKGGKTQERAPTFIKT
ncbi:MAG: flavin reductase family protein [Deltaproteobacteria bacterium]|nr:flavin reductase family protein [Deltaproteobacteria bacterium]